MEKWIEIIIGHHVLLARLRIEREQDKLDVVVEQAVLQMPVKRNQRRVIEIRVLRPPLKIKREQSEQAAFRAGLGLPAGKAQNLHELDPILRAETPPGKQRIQKFRLRPIHLRRARVAEQRSQVPLPFQAGLLRGKERPDRFLPPSRFQRQTVIRPRRPGDDFILRRTIGQSQLRHRRMAGLIVRAANLRLARHASHEDKPAANPRQYTARLNGGTRAKK